MNAMVAACDGNLALCVRKPSLRVIEGGLSQHAKATPTRINAMTLIVVIMVLLALVWYATDRHAEAKAQSILGTVDCETIVVGKGDTLWQIADTRHVEGCTTARVVRFIREVNALDTAMLHEGDLITVPQSVS
jgi:hypothetical protein